MATIYKRKDPESNPMNSLDGYLLVLLLLTKCPRIHNFKKSVIWLTVWMQGAFICC